MGREGGVSVYWVYWGRGRGGGWARSDGEGTHQDLEGLQAGCSHSVLRKGILVSNGAEVERVLPVESFRLESAAMLMTGLSIWRSGGFRHR